MKTFGIPAMVLRFGTLKNVLYDLIYYVVIKYFSCLHVFYRVSLYIIAASQPLLYGDSSYCDEVCMSVSLSPCWS